MQLWQTEFPHIKSLGFDPATDLPEGFVDESWRNDACPNFFNEAKSLRLWVETEDPDARESGELSQRFSLYRSEKYGEQAEEILETDDWQEMRTRLESFYLFDRLPPSTTRDDVVRYLTALAQSDYTYHIDDDPAQIIQFKSGDSIFTADHVHALRANMIRIREVTTWDDAWQIYSDAMKAAGKS